MRDNHIIEDTIAYIDRLGKKYKQLEAENARLKEECNMYKTFYRAKHNDINGILFKYKTCLQKIKELAEKSYHTSLIEKDCVVCDDYLGQILQLINESEEE